MTSQHGARNLLRSFPNVLVISHQALLTHEALSEIARDTTDNFLRCECGGDFFEATSALAKRKCRLPV